MKPWILIIMLLAGRLSTVAQTATSATVPMTFQGPIPVVEVMINGKGPFHFTVDTGGGIQASVESAVAAQLNLKPNGRAMGGDPSGRNGRMFDTVLVDSLSVGGVEFRNVTALSRQPRTGPNLPGVDGILGFGLFTDYLLTLDYPGQQLRLARGELPAANGADILRFENSRVIPIVEVSIGDMKVKAHIDSGNIVGNFLLPTELVDKLKLASPAVTVGRAHTVSNDVEIKQATLSDSIKLGSVEFKQPTITFPTPANEMNIGLKTLREFSVTFDQKNRRVKFEYHPTQTSDAAKSSSTSQGNEYVGNYGERRILAEADGLYLQRAGGPRLKLVAVLKDEFTLEGMPAARIRFVRDANGKITELRVLNREGEWEVSRKGEP